MGLSWCKQKGNIDDELLDPSSACPTRSGITPTRSACRPATSRSSPRGHRGRPLTASCLTISLPGRQAWQNAEAALAKAGASIPDVVSIRQWLTDADDIKA
jgi:hypothetical protein